MKPLVSFRKAATDPHLLGKFLGGASRKALRAVLLAFLAEPLTDAEREDLQYATGRAHEPLERGRELLILAGRRGGKSSGVGALAVYLALLCDYSDNLIPGEMGVVLVLAKTQDQAQTLLSYIAGVINSVPALKKLVLSQAALSITLSNQVRIEVRAASSTSLRGPTYIGILCDEITAWDSKESGANPDSEIITAVQPGLITTGGPLIMIGTAKDRSGYAYRRFCRFYGPDGDPGVMIARAPTRFFNPTLTEDEIARDIELADNPAAMRAEYMCEFTGDVEAYFSRDIVKSVTPPGIRELPFVPGTCYIGFVDPAGGNAADFIALAIAHGEANSAVLDVLRVAKPPFNPDTVIADFCSLLKRYRITHVLGDIYGSGLTVQSFARNGITYEIDKRSKSEIYTTAVPLFTSGRVQLLENEQLANELVGLDRTVSKTGKETIAKVPGAHDDLANAACGALTLAVGDYNVILSRYCDCLHNDRPVEIPTKCRSVFAVLTRDKQSRAAVVYYVWTKPAPKPRAPTETVPAILIIADFETGLFGSEETYSRIRQRLDELVDAHGVFGACLYAEDAIAADATERGYPAISLVKLTGRDDLGSIAAVHVNADLVKVSALADEKSQTEPLRDALAFRGGIIEDPLSLALAYGIVAQLDKASA